MLHAELELDRACKAVRTSRWPRTACMPGTFAYTPHRGTVRALSLHAQYLGGKNEQQPCKCLGAGRLAHASAGSCPCPGCCRDLHGYNCCSGASFCAFVEDVSFLMIANPASKTGTGLGCYTEQATEARHRQERQQQWYKQNHQQPNHAATKQPTNKTKTYTPVI